MVIRENNIRAYLRGFELGKIEKRIFTFKQ